MQMANSISEVSCLQQRVRERDTQWEKKKIILFDDILLEYNAISLFTSDLIYFTLQVIDIILEVKACYVISF